MVGTYLGGDDLARLLEHAFQGVDDDDAPLLGVLVEMPVMLVVCLGSLQQQTFRQLPHLWSVAAHGDDEPALFPALVRGEDGGVEEILLGWSAAVNDIGVADLLLEQTLVLVKGGRQDAKLGLRPALTVLGGLGDDGELLKNTTRIGGEAAVDDVDVLNGAASHHQGQADVPISLHAAAEDGDGLDVVASVEKARRAEGGTKGGQRARLDEAQGLAVGCEQVDDTGRANGFDGWVLGGLGRGQGDDCLWRQ